VLLEDHAPDAVFMLNVQYNLLSGLGAGVAPVINACKCLITLITVRSSNLFILAYILS